jgi:hypothetical protein
MMKIDSVRKEVMMVATTDRKRCYRETLVRL